MKKKYFKNEFKIKIVMIYLSHLTSQIAALGSKQEEWQEQSICVIDQVSLRFVYICIFSISPSWTTMVLFTHFGAALVHLASLTVEPSKDGGDQPEAGVWLHSAVR